MSVPLKAAGFSTLNSFFWGQASGMVEPIAGIIGTFISLQLCLSLAILRMNMISDYYSLSFIMMRDLC